MKKMLTMKFCRRIINYLRKNIDVLRNVFILWKRRGIDASLFIYAVTYIKIMFSPQKIGKRYITELVFIFLGGIYNGET